MANKFITDYSGRTDFNHTFFAYYSFGTMIFGVHEASAIKDFWFTEIMLGTAYVSIVIVITIYTAITRFLKKRKNDASC